MITFRLMLIVIAAEKLVRAFSFRPIFAGRNPLVTAQFQPELFCTGWSRHGCRRQSKRLSCLSGVCPDACPIVSALILLGVSRISDSVTRAYYIMML